MAVSKPSSDIEKYWALMNKYNSAASLIGRQYILDIEMRGFLADVGNARVYKLLSEFIQSKET